MMPGIGTDLSAAKRTDGDGPTVGPWPRTLGTGAEAPLLERTAGQWRIQMRDELALPVATPLIAGGHQATLWHPGIAMKTIAADEMARLTGAATWHLVVDTDAHEVACPMPVRGPDGTLRTVDVSLEDPRDARPRPSSVGAVAPIAELPTGRRPALIAPAADRLPAAALPQVDAGVASIVAALQTERDAGDLAMQMTRAMLRLLEPLAATPRTIIRSSQLLDTTLGQALLDRMRADARRCAETYNAAVAGTPGSGTPLTIGAAVELPLWRIDAHGRRRRATAGDLDTPDRAAVLLPRALLVTALVRLGAADLFIHGTGGMAYDVAMERWIEAWLGASPAPAALVTATLRLPLPEREVSADIVAAAIAERRRRWWDPQRFVQGGDGRPKLDDVAAIEASPRGSTERAALYRRMHDRIERLREHAAPAIEEATRRAEDVRRLAAGRPVALSRTWPFPMHEIASLTALADATRQAVNEADRA